MPPIHFEIHAENPQRTTTPHTDLFGWTLSKGAVPEIPILARGRRAYAHDTDGTMFGIMQADANAQ